MTDKTNADVQRDAIFEVMGRYCENVEAGLDERWSKLKVDLFDTSPQEVAGALLARQATLTTQLTRSPGNWNGHTAPLFLRSMVDAHISLAWVLRDPATRAKQFILYGLGQEKLILEHLKQYQSEATDPDDRMTRMIEIREDWLNSQRRDFMTEVNVGSWSGQNTREMAEEADCSGLYKYAYLPFSGVTHNMWQHIAVYNLRPCTNALHKYHRIPSMEDVPLDPDYVYRSAKYVSRSYEAFDSSFGVECETELPVKFFVREMNALSGEDIDPLVEPDGNDSSPPEDA